MRVPVLFFVFFAFMGFCFAEEYKLPDAAEIRALQEQARATQLKGVEWLMAGQNADGSFGDAEAMPQPGITALVIYAVMQTPEAVRTKYQEPLKKAEAFVQGRQADGGAFSSTKGRLQGYNTALSVLALQAFDAEGNKDRIQKGATFLKKMQLGEGQGLTEKDRNYGGWSYDPGMDKADLSNTGFAIDALKAAGIPEKDGVFLKAMVFVRKCQKNTATNPLTDDWVSKNADGGFIYMIDRMGFGGAGRGPKPETVKTGDVKSDGENAKSLPEGDKTSPALPADPAKREINSYASMTYEGISSMQKAGMNITEPAMMAALKWVSAHYDTDRNVGQVKEREGIYYCRFIMARTFRLLGCNEILTDQGKRNWAADLVRSLVKDQDPAGFWKNPNDKWQEDNPVIATAMAVATLGLADKALAEKLAALAAETDTKSETK